MEPAPYPSETSVEAHLKKYSSQMRALETDLSMVQVEIDGMEKLQTRDVKMFVSSWNMGNEPAVGLEHLIPLGGGDMDLFVFGLQESTYDSKKDHGGPSDSSDGAAASAAPDSTPKTKKDKSLGESSELACVEVLKHQLSDILGEDFYLVVHNRRVQMQLFIFARKALNGSISNIETSSENTGFLHVFPNKGGINASLTIDGTKLAFVSCHLAAHEGVAKCATRNQSCYEILEGLRTGSNRDLDIAVQFHHTIWMGDMNYRTTFDPKTPTALSSVPSADVQISTPEVGCDDNNKMCLDDENDELVEETETSETREKNMQEIYKLIKDGNYQAILAKDELNRELSAFRVLMNFTALQPSFNPTFKRKRRMVLTEAAKADDLVETFYDKKRMPSYTDRILYSSLPGFVPDLSPLLFQSCEETDSSDHKPVFAHFALKTRGGVRDITVPRDMLSYVQRSKKRIDLRSNHYTEIKIHNLKGYNLSEMDLAMFGVGGKSDPYVRITVDPMEAVCVSNSKLESSIIKHELNPDWKDEDLTVALWGTDKIGLSYNVHLLLSVWDWDMGNPHDLIGTCAIPIKLVIGAGEEHNSYHFRLPLLRNGTFHGELEGEIRFSTLKNKKHSTLQQAGAPQESIVLNDFLESMENAPQEPLGCGCTII